jgi:hypothetical protein
MIVITTPTGQIGHQILNNIYNADPRTPQSNTPTSFRQWCEDMLKPAVLAMSQS